MKNYNRPRWKPWQLSPDSDPEQRFIVTTEDGEQEICGIVCDKETAVEIASVPEMLAALQYVADCTAGPLTKTQAATLGKRCREALAKAGAS